jgi:hypothetical protein
MATETPDSMRSIPFMLCAAGIAVLSSMSFADSSQVLIRSRRVSIRTPASNASSS